MQKRARLTASSQKKMLGRQKLQILGRNAGIVGPDFPDRRAWL